MQLMGALVEIGFTQAIKREKFIAAATPIWAPTIRGIIKRGALFAIAMAPPDAPPPLKDLVTAVSGAVDSKLKDGAIGPVVRPTPVA